MDGWTSPYFSLLNNRFLLGEHLHHLLLVEGCRYQVPLPGSPVTNDHLAPLFDQESVLLASHVLCRSGLRKWVDLKHNLLLQMYRDKYAFFLPSELGLYRKDKISGFSLTAITGVILVLGLSSVHI